MAAVLSKRKMTEEDIKLQFITPAITKKWALSLITMETRITDGQINLRGNMVSRKEAKKADYILYLNESTPIAIVEAKDNKHAVGDGLQQAMQYAIILIMRSWTVWSAVSTMNYPLRSRNRGRGCAGGQSQNLFNTGIMHRPNRKDASEWFA